MGELRGRIERKRCPALSIQTNTFSHFAKLIGGGVIMKKYIPKKPYLFGRSSGGTVESLVFFYGDLGLIPANAPVESCRMACA